MYLKDNVFDCPYENLQKEYQHEIILYFFNQF